MERDLSGDMKGWMEWVEHIGHQTFCEEWLIAALFPLQVLITYCMTENIRLRSKPIQYR